MASGMKEVLAIAKALSDESRLRILQSLRDEPLCLAQLTEIVGLAASTVSKHMQVLSQAGLVTTWAEGRWHFFAQTRGEGHPAARDALAWATRHAFTSLTQQTPDGRRSPPAASSSPNTPHL